MKSSNFKLKIISILVVVSVVMSLIGIQTFAKSGSDLPDGLTKFVFDKDTVLVSEGNDTNYEVVVYDNTDNETAAVTTVSDEGTLYSLPEGSEGQLLVSIKKKGGSYVFEGNGNGSIAVKKEASKDAVLYFNGLELTSAFTSVLTVKKDSTASCTIYVVGGTENTLTDNSYNNGTYEENLAAEKAVMKFKAGSNVIFDGSGTLNIIGNAKNGIKSANEITFNGSVVYNIDVVDNGISSDKSIVINGGDFNIKTKEGDGIKAASDEEPVGDVTINGGNITIDSYSDGIQATANIAITDGVFDITCYGGYASKYDGDDDSYPSAKALKASGSYIVTGDNGEENEIDNSDCYINISGGSFMLDSADDAIHSDKDLTVSGGTFTIHTGDDAFHSEYVTTIGSNTSTKESLVVNILHSYEGIEGAVVNLYDGTYKIYSSDDCVNAANSDLRNYSFAINVYDGDIYASTTKGDCFDSNKDINIYGGQVVVLGTPLNSDGNACLDCDGSLNIKGGVVFGIGLSTMAENPASGMSYVTWSSSGSSTAVSSGASGSNRPGGAMGGNRPGASMGNNRPGSNQSGGFISNGSTVSVSDASGNELFSTVAYWDTTSNINVNYVIFSSEDVKSGSSYTLSVSQNVTPTRIPLDSNDDENSTEPPQNPSDMPSDIPGDMPSDMPGDFPGDNPGDGDGGFYYGDADLSKIVDAADALMVLKHAAKLELIKDGLALDLSDVNHDNNIDASDALEILKIAAKLRSMEIMSLSQNK